MKKEQNFLSVLQQSYEKTPLKSEKKIAIVRSLFNNAVVSRLLAGMEHSFSSLAPQVTYDVFDVPGAYEIPFFVKKICKEKKSYDAIVTCGALVRGDTAHFDAICDHVVQGLSVCTTTYEIPILFGVLTTYTQQQADKRSRLKPIEENKGYEVGLSCLHLLATLDKS